MEAVVASAAVVTVVVVVTESNFCVLLCASNADFASYGPNLSYP